jgi:hypothetical protein
VITLATISALLAASANAVAGTYGAWRWWRVEPSRAFWVLVRVAQATAVLMAVAAGVIFLSGARPDNGLFWLYALLPSGINLFAEQFRLTAAQTVLDARELENAAAVGGLSEREQRSILLQIVRREMGVMTVAAFVTCFLALRALSEVSGL